MKFLDNVRDRNIELTPEHELAKCLEDPQLLEWFLDTKREHYALLSWVSKQFDGVTLYDIGTYKGLSALALAANPNNKVISYDIENFLELKDPPSNIDFRIGNFFEDQDILKSPFIMFDVDPHDGGIETRAMYWLKASGYKYTIMFDDIHLNANMQSFWNQIEDEKHDLTDFGHWSGTGLVFLQ